MAGPDYAKLEALSQLPEDAEEADLSRAGLVVVPEDLLRLTSLTVSRTPKNDR